MRQIKNIVCCISCFLLVSTILCGNAFADVTSTPFPDVPAGASYAEAAAVLSEMGIFKGDDNGNFNPDSSITRAEAAAVICRMLGVEDEAKQMTSVVFTDVPASHWSVGYVAKAAELGIIGGYGDGRFGPEDSVTYEQMLKMLLNMWGYEGLAKEYQQADGTWSDGYLQLADSMEITKNISFTPSMAAPRSSVALLCYRTFNTARYDELWDNF